MVWMPSVADGPGSSGTICGLPVPPKVVGIAAANTTRFQRWKDNGSLHSRPT